MLTPETPIHGRLELTLNISDISHCIACCSQFFLNYIVVFIFLRSFCNFSLKSFQLEHGGWRNEENEQNEENEAGLKVKLAIPKLCKRPTLFIGCIICQTCFEKEFQKTSSLKYFEEVISIETSRTLLKGNKILTASTIKYSTHYISHKSIKEKFLTEAFLISQEKKAWRTISPSYCFEEWSQNYI